MDKRKGRETTLVITSEIQFKGYTVHASMDKSQYLIKSDKIDHMAMNKGAALKKIGKK